MAERESVNDTGYEACYLKTLSVAKDKASVGNGWVNECEGSIEGIYRQAKPEVLGNKLVPLPKILHEFTRD
jgi:hypothetical protein